MKLIDADVLEDQFGVSDADIVAKEIIREAVAVDAVPVTRCPECKYHRENEGFHFCKRMGVYIPDDSEFFCAYGEREGVI